MRLGLTLSILLVLALLLTQCAPGQSADATRIPSVNITPEPSPTLALTPSLSSGLDKHLLVGVEGKLSRKRPGWTEYVPLSFGSTLDRDDLLRAEHDAHGLVICADLSLVHLPTGYHGGLPCPQTQAALMRGSSPVVGARRGNAASPSIPYVISPRHTFTSSAHPVLRWHPTSTGVVTYTVRIRGGDLEWETEVAANELRYPTDAPRLRPNVPYRLIVQDDDGRSSTEERTPLDLSFALLPTEVVEGIEAVVERVDLLGLDDQGNLLLEAEIHAKHHLRSDAIALLSQLVTMVDSPVVHQRLGDLYLEVGLCAEAREAYRVSQAAYADLRDWAGEGTVLLGLAVAHEGLGDDASARDNLQSAQDLFQRLGDAEGQAMVEGLMAELGGVQ